MSLKDKYYNEINAAEVSQEERASFARKKKQLLSCGLDISMFDPTDTVNLPINLSQEDQKSFNEAIELVKTDRWNQACFKYTKEDVKYNSDGLKRVKIVLINKLPLYNDKATEYSLPFDYASFVKYKWDDGSVRLGKLKSESMITDTGFFSFDAKAKAVTPHFLSDVNKKHEQIIPYLLGSQRYVILVFFNGQDDDGGDRKEYLVLFEDGYLFAVKNNTLQKSVRIEGKYIDDGFGSNRKPLDDWLIENIKRINT